MIFLLRKFYLDPRILWFLYCRVWNIKPGIFIVPKSHSLELLDLGGRCDIR